MLNKSKSQIYNIKKSKLNEINDFYSVVINAIKQNNDNIVNKRECIEKILQLKSSRRNENRKKSNINSLLNKERLSLKNKTVQFSNDENKKEEIENNSEKKILKQNISQPEIISEFQKKELNKEEKKIQKPKTKTRIRYNTFKRIKNYLESNNILLSDFIKKNPFQNKPFEIRNSNEFLENVKFSNYKFVNEALNQNKNFLFSYDYFGQTAFHWSAKLGDLKMLKILISKGKNLNIKDNKGRTPIYFAALNNHFDCVKILYENGGNVFIDDINGKKPIDVTNNINIKYYLTDIMDFPYNNPFIKKNVAKILKIREDNIIKKEMKNKNLKDSIFDKENNKKDINERNE